MTKYELLRRYKKKHRQLVKPKQGWDSLNQNLWLAYSMGRKRGFTDLGTYANKPGDHGHTPSDAFDLGREDRFLFKGWGYIKARRLALLYVKYYKQLDIEYVILGKRIWSRERPYWHSFDRDSSHMFHIHVSGIGDDV